MSELSVVFCRIGGTINIMSNQLQQPFIDIIGNRSPVQQTIKLCWQLLKDKPETIGGTIESKSAAALILTHLLGLMESAGMVNCRGWHSSAITLLRATEDALDCFAAVGSSHEATLKWQNGKLKASDAAKAWTDGHFTNKHESMAGYRKMIRTALNQYSHCTPEQANWNIYLESIGDSLCTMELNTESMVINMNAYYIDRYLCIHLYEVINVILDVYGDYLKSHMDLKKQIEKATDEIVIVIEDFLKFINEEKLDISVAPELLRIERCQNKQ